MFLFKIKFMFSVLYTGMTLTFDIFNCFCDRININFVFKLSNKLLNFHGPLPFSKWCKFKCKTTPEWSELKLL